MLNNYSIAPSQNINTYKMSIIIATHFESHTHKKENGTQAKQTKSIVSGCLKKVNRQIVINHLLKPYKTITRC